MLLACSYPLLLFLRVLRQAEPRCGNRVTSGSGLPVVLALFHSLGGEWAQRPCSSSDIAGMLCLYVMQWQHRKPAAESRGALSCSLVVDFHAILRLAYTKHWNGVMALNDLGGDTVEKNSIGRDRPKLAMVLDVALGSHVKSSTLEAAEDGKRARSHQREAPCCDCMQSCGVVKASRRTVK